MKVADSISKEFQTYTSIYVNTKTVEWGLYGMGFHSQAAAYKPSLTSVQMPLKTFWLCNQKQFDYKCYFFSLKSELFKPGPVSVILFSMLWVKTDFFLSLSPHQQGLVPVRAAKTAVEFIIRLKAETHTHTHSSAASYTVVMCRCAIDSVAVGRSCCSVWHWFALVVSFIHRPLVCSLLSQYKLSVRRGF